MCYLTVLETRHPKLRVWQGHDPSGGTREGSIPEMSASFWYLLGLW